MGETKVLVKLKGVPASVLPKLVEKGYHSTKSEAIRRESSGCARSLESSSD